MENANFKMETSKLKPPFAWVGGKSKIAKAIVELMPKHSSYMEVFGGSLAVLYAKERLGHKYTEVVNDLNGELINRKNNAKICFSKFLANSLYLSLLWCISSNELGAFI